MFPSQRIVRGPPYQWARARKLLAGGEKHNNVNQFNPYILNLLNLQIFNPYIPYLAGSYHILPGENLLRELGTDVQRAIDNTIGY